MVLSETRSACLARARFAAREREHTTVTLPARDTRCRVAQIGAALPRVRCRVVASVPTCVTVSGPGATNVVSTTAAVGDTSCVEALSGRVAREVLGVGSGAGEGAGDDAGGFGVGEGVGDGAGGSGVGEGVGDGAGGSGAAVGVMAVDAADSGESTVGEDVWAVAVNV